MTFPHSPHPPGPRPGPPPAARPGPPPFPAGAGGSAGIGDRDGVAPGDGTGHPAVDAVLQSLANAVHLPPAEQIAAYEAAHRVLQETLAGIDG